MLILNRVDFKDTFKRFMRIISKKMHNEKSEESKIKNYHCSKMLCDNHCRKWSNSGKVLRDNMHFTYDVWQ